MAAKISQLVNPHSTCFTFMKVVYYLGRKLELRQFKNGLASVKSMLVLKLPHFFPCPVGERKKGGNVKTNIFFKVAGPFL